MNDVSLTGCFLNDLQSPGKASSSGMKNVGLISAMNDNSRDSIFLNVKDLINNFLSQNVFLKDFNTKDGHDNGSIAARSEPLRRLVHADELQYKRGDRKQQQRRTKQKRLLILS